jgi:hypothetical protein
LSFDVKGFGVRIYVSDFWFGFRIKGLRFRV